MRSQNHGLRIAVATVYLRYREARASYQRQKDRCGGQSVWAQDMHQKMLANWNTLQVLKDNLSRHQYRYAPLMDSHKFVDLVARRARLINDEHKASLERAELADAQ